MKTCLRLICLTFCFIMMMMLFSACEKQKQGKLEVTEKSFQLRRFSDNGWSIDATGKVKNVGAVDVKRVSVTGKCRSCVNSWVKEKWFTATEQEEVPVTDKKAVAEAIGTGAEQYQFDQVDVIQYIAVGAEEAFQVKDIAYFYTRLKNTDPDPIPAELDIMIKSFEMAD